MDKLKIIIAEDDGVTQMFYDEGLSDDTFDKRIVGDGQEAVSEYESWNPDIVVLDMMMPIKNGQEALIEIRKMEKDCNRRTMVVMATAISTKEDIHQCAKIGIEGYISKPFEISEISDLILKCYEKFQSSNNTE